MHTSPDSSFASLGLDSRLCRMVQDLGWTEPSPIQRSSIPVALKGQDVIGIAETGSGKTGAFLLPIIQDWAKAGHPTGFALLLVPTRELVKQLSDEAIRLGRSDSDEADTEPSVRVVQLVGGEDMVDQALQLAWHRHHMIIGKRKRSAEFRGKGIQSVANQIIKCLQLKTLHDAISNLT
ncbi:unnamed protein product [Echinostoma caproni]|uniref:RNA helicase n=1 Tax=Echinostoma caproni TaxID=27848 RepID=A0A183A1K3_9TREM|nr:unnamed protein product [Echinostoma caproni]